MERTGCKIGSKRRVDLYDRFGVGIFGKLEAGAGGKRGKTPWDRKQKQKMEIRNWGPSRGLLQWVSPRQSAKGGNEETKKRGGEEKIGRRVNRTI